jgi:hypothetical protein
MPGTLITQNVLSACEGDTLPALIVWFHRNLAGFPNSADDATNMKSVLCFRIKIFCPLGGTSPPL